MFSTLFALTACQDLGRQLTKEEGETIYADIKNHNLTKMPEVFTLNEKINYSSYVADFTDKNGNPIPDRVYSNSDYDYNIILEDLTEEVAREITEYLKTTGRMQKTIVFCANEDHAERMRVDHERARFHQHGQKVLPLHLTHFGMRQIPRLIEPVDQRIGALEGHYHTGKYRQRDLFPDPLRLFLVGVVKFEQLLERRGLFIHVDIACCKQKY